MKSLLQKSKKTLDKHFHRPKSTHERRHAKMKFNLDFYKVTILLIFCIDKDDAHYMVKGRSSELNHFNHEQVYQPLAPKTGQYMFQGLDNDFEVDLNGRRRRQVQFHRYLERKTSDVTEGYKPARDSHRRTSIVYLDENNITEKPLFNIIQNLRKTKKAKNASKIKINTKNHTNIYKPEIRIVKKIRKLKEKKKKKHKKKVMQVQVMGSTLIPWDLKLGDKFGDDKLGDEKLTGDVSRMSGSKSMEEEERKPMDIIVHIKMKE